MSRRHCIRIVVGVGVASIALVAAGAATTSAAVPCQSVQREVNRTVEQVRVAVVNAPCEVGREVTEDFYGRLDSGAFNPTKHIDGFLCSTVLASSELTCHSGSRWIFASDLPEDHPANSHVPRQPGPRKLGKGAAAYYMRTALNRQYTTFRHAAGTSIACNRRVSRGRVRCGITWVIGDVGFFGTGAIWITYPHHIAHWNYRWRIHEINEYCALVEHRSFKECSRALVVR